MKDFTRYNPEKKLPTFRSLILLMCCIFMHPLQADSSIAVVQNTCISTSEHLIIAFPFATSIESLGAALAGQLVKSRLNAYQWQPSTQQWQSSVYEDETERMEEEVSISTRYPFVISISSEHHSEDNPLILSFTGFQSPLSPKQSIYPGLNLLHTPETGDIFWHFSTETEPYILQESTSGKTVDDNESCYISDITYDADENHIRLTLKNDDSKKRSLTLFYQDVDVVNPDLETVWRPLGSVIDIEAGNTFIFLDSGGQTRPHPRVPGARLYTAKDPADSALTIDPEAQSIGDGNEEATAAIHSEQTGQSLPLSGSSTALFTPSNSTPISQPTGHPSTSFPRLALPVSEPLTPSEAEQLVAEEMAFRLQRALTKADRLKNSPASKEWFIDSDKGRFIFRQINEPDANRQGETRQVSNAQVSTFQFNAVTEMEQRTVMVTAKVVDHQVSETLWRGPKGETQTHIFDGDFTLLEGVQTFAHDNILWTVFVIAENVDASVSPDVLSTLTANQALDPGLDALLTYYRANEEELRRTKARNKLLNEARQAWRNANPPEPEDTIINFWKVVR